MATFSADVVAMRHASVPSLTERGYFPNPRNNHLIHIPILRLSQTYQIISLTTVGEESVARRKPLEPQRVKIRPTFSHRDVCRRISNWPWVEGLDRQSQDIRSLKGGKSHMGKGGVAGRRETPVVGPVPMADSVGLRFAGPSTTDERSATKDGSATFETVEYGA